MAALVLSILLGACGQVFFKLGVQGNSAEGVRFYISLLAAPWIWAGAIAYGASFLLWMQVLKFFDISFARPLTAAGYALTYLLAVLFLGEEVLPRRILATLLITGGVVLMR
jgi:uncharacterized membrane protein